ncbi:MAG: DNA methyltransferase [Thiomicrospira sp.]
MKRLIKHQKSSLNLTAIKLEGSLFLPDQLEKAALGQSKYQEPKDYLIPLGVKFKEEYSRAYQIAIANWKQFAEQTERQDLQAGLVTRHFVETLFKQVFGYHRFNLVNGVTLNELHYPISAMAGSLPIIIAPHTQTLDEACESFAVEGAGTKKKSAFQLAQSFLNASDEHLWALVTNGRQLRLLRDADTLTRPSYLEIDLQDLLSAQRFSEFQNAWRLVHASRADLQGECIWENWRNLGKEEGTRVRNGLRQGVTDALLTLGQGFIEHPDNQALREALYQGQLTPDAYFQQLLRLIYRFIFLFTVEERDLLQPKTQLKARQLYAQGYAMSRLRDRCLNRRALTHHADLWQGVRIVFKGLADGQQHLALPALGGLFNANQCPHIDQAQLSNRALLLAMESLRWFKPLNNQLAPVDYRNMGPEELGSVYESLLELVPEVSITEKRFGFVGITTDGSNQGNARKTSGSYYTPDELVQELIKSALEPVIAEKMRQQPDNPQQALLSLRIIDPACGSGHFLLAAARRLAEELAGIRALDGAVTDQDYRHALREVIANCIFGVDKNPMAIELARTALWLEGFEENQPLSFLDHHLQVGDALLGIMDWDQLSQGIPADAFKALSGDDKQVLKALAAQNRNGLKAFQKRQQNPQLQLLPEDTTGLKTLQAIEAMPQTTPKQIAKQEAAYLEFLNNAKQGKLAQAADLFVGAFLMPKTVDQQACTTSETLYRQLYEEHLQPTDLPILQAAQQACQNASVFHWPLAFPQVFAKGGFDCVLANPPWERIKLQEEEFFATRHTDIASAKNKAERSQRIQWLAEGMLSKHLFPEMEHALHECEAEQRLYAEFISVRRTAEAISVFAHVKGEDGGRYPLTGVGDVNTYALFSETIRQITSPIGRAGFIVPSGLATDNSTKDFFGDLISKNSLLSFFEFENEGFFPGAGQGHMLRFALTTIVGLSQQVTETKYMFQGKRLEHLNDPERIFTLRPADIQRVNPNTLTCPIFQSRFDAELTKKIYQKLPVMVLEAQGNQPEVNPWGISFMRMFDMSNDSHLFKTRQELSALGYGLEGDYFVKGAEKYARLYEAKMINLYNHRHGDFSDAQNGERAHILPTIPIDRLNNSAYRTSPYYWVPLSDVMDRAKQNGGFFIFRSINNSANARAFLGSLIPYSGVGNSAVVVQTTAPKRIEAALWAAFSSIVFEYLIRQKLGGTNINFFILKQMPVPTPDQFDDGEIDFVSARVIELSYTAEDMAPWAESVGFIGNPFAFNPLRRAKLVAELDVFYARKYGLDREELRYILDPSDVKGDGYPSETFAVLKRNEMREHGEYRTQRLVLEAWDKLERGELH